MQDLNTKIYYTSSGPVNPNQSGLFRTTRQMFVELVLSRELIWILFLRDFKARYRQSLLGILWVFLMPVLTVGMFVGMSRTGVLNIQRVGIPYPLYALVGLTVWSIFSVGLTACANALVNAGGMIVKINFPKVSLIVAAFGQALVEFCIRLIIIASACIYYGIFPSFTSLCLFLVCLLPTCLITIGLGFLLSLMAGVARDTLNVLAIVLLAGMLLTPVLYPLEGSSLIAVANGWNPLNYLVTVPRDVLLMNYSLHGIGFIWSSIVALIIFYVGWRLFYLAQSKIAERI